MQRGFSRYHKHRKIVISLKYQISQIEFQENDKSTVLKFRAYFQQLGQQERQYRRAFLLLKGRRERRQVAGVSG